ncbi:unnamed protein product [Closterium sp. NIES-64]|nr:unnamed protein product [Closterium sp. NIES-64]
MSRIPAQRTAIPSFVSTCLVAPAAPCLLDRFYFFASFRKVLAECAVELGATDYNWEPNAPCTTDEGLVCNADGTVNTIDLSGAGLKGSICSVIGNLTTLVSLDLSYNSLSGPIPASIGQLPLLESLDLSYNMLWSALPSTIGSLSSLTNLDLASNTIEGALPSAIGSLSNLKILDLVNNDFNGIVPASLRALTNLRLLDLGKNSFSGSFPTVVSKLTRLSLLSLISNKFGGVISSSISLLSDLKAIDVSSNSFKGEILPPIAALSNLIFINLADNEFSGSIPSDFGRLTDLETLILMYNQFTGSIPQTLSLLKTLTHLDLANNLFQGTIPYSFVTLTDLNMIDLSSNNFQGTIASFFATLTKLSVLLFGENKFSGGIPSQFESLTNLTYLSFASNNLSGTVPPNLGSLPLLMELELNESGAVCPTGAGQPNLTESGAVCPTAIIGIAAVGGVLVIVLLVIGLFLLWKRRSSPQGQEQPKDAQASDGATEAGEVSAMPNQAHMCQRYSFATVAKATDNWAEGNHAIKEPSAHLTFFFLFPSFPHLEQVEEMASKSHPHLVQLLGYCVDIDMMTEHHEQIVIYEFCSKGDLEKYLTGGERGHWSFGVLVLEVMLTRPAVAEEKGVNTSIKDWAARCVQDQDVQGLKDPHLESIPSELLLQVVELALRCTGMPASSRPHMREVAARLDALSKEFLQNTTPKADSRLESIDQEVAMRHPEQSLDDEFLRIDVISGACD